VAVSFIGGGNRRELKYMYIKKKEEHAFRHPLETLK
jgi:hypothetical protein